MAWPCRPSPRPWRARGCRSRSGGRRGLGALVAGVVGQLGAGVAGEVGGAGHEAGERRRRSRRRAPSRWPGGWPASRPARTSAARPPSPVPVPPQAASHAARPRPDVPRGDGRARCSRGGPAGWRPSTRSTPTSGRRGTRHGAAPARRAGRTPCRRSTWARSWPPAQAMVKVLGAMLPVLPGHRVRRRRPHRQHRRQAARRRRPADRREPRRPPGLLRHPRARHGRGDGRAWRCTAASCPSAGTFFVFLDYMRPPVRLAALSAGQGACSSSATTRSASARTARRTSRSSTWRRCGRSPGCR